MFMRAIHLFLISSEDTCIYVGFSPLDEEDSPQWRDKVNLRNRQAEFSAHLRTMWIHSS